MIDVSTGVVTPAVLGHDDEIGNAAWSADGTAILFGRRNTQIVSRSLKTGAEHLVFDGAPEQLTIGRGNFQTFGVSPDGRAIAFRVIRAAGTSETPGIGTLRVKFFDGRVADLLTGSAAEGFEFQDWTPDSRGVIFVRFSQSDRQKRTLWRASLDGREPRNLGLTMTALREFRVHPDGRLATFTAGVANEAELWAAENFVVR
jgi:Tol biopolymer transport system component